MNSNQSSDASNARPSRRWWQWVAAGLIVFVIGFPWILAKTALRDRLLNAIVASDDVRVSSQDASFGYLTPLGMDGLRIEATDESALVQVERIEADHSWLGLLMARPELGTFRFVRPTIDVLVKERPNVADEGDESVGTPPEPPTTEKSADERIELPVLAAEIRDASVTIRSTRSVEPPIDVQGFDLTVRLEKPEGGSVLKIDPSTLFDHQELTPELCGQGLQLVAPMMADAVDAEGAFSLRLDQFNVPLNKSEDVSAIQIKGELELHQAKISFKDTMATQVVALVIQVIGRTFGQNESGPGGLPDTISVAEGVKVRFQVVDGRIHHEGLAFLLPHQDSSIEITSSGSVGLDESLDLQLAIALPESILGKSGIVNALLRKPLVIGIGGTLQEPQLGLPQAADWTQEGAMEETVTDILGGLLNRAPDRSAKPASEEQEEPGLNQPLLPRLRDRLRERPRPLRRGRDVEPEAI